MVAAVIAMVVAVLVYVVLNRQAPRPEPTEAANVTIVVAKSKIPAYTEISEGMLETKTIPRDQAPAQALDDPKQAIGRLSQFAVAQGEPLTRGDVVTPGAEHGLTFRIPEGMRAVTVALDPITGVGGFIQPGDRVDVLACFDADREPVTTKTILQDVTVLAINEQTVRPPIKKPVTSDESAEKTEEKSPATEQVKSATVAVTPQQAQVLVLSATRGTIHLVLRAREDHEHMALDPSDEWSLVGKLGSVVERLEKPDEPEQPGWPSGWGPPPGQEPEEEPEDEEPEKAEPPLPTVEVLRGNDREVVTVGS